MSSKQINFYIVPDDYKLIDQFLKDHLCNVMVNNYIDKGLNPLNILPKIDEEIYQVYLCNDRFDDKIKVTRNDKVKYFDVFESYLIEFSLGGFFPYDRTLLQRARLYFVTSYYKEDSLVYKNPDFLKWCDDFFKEFKKKFLKKFNNEKSVYYSENAIKWITEKEAIYLLGKNQWKQTL